MKELEKEEKKREKAEAQDKKRAENEVKKEQQKELSKKRSGAKKVGEWLGNVRCRLCKPDQHCMQ